MAFRQTICCKAAIRLAGKTVIKKSNYIELNFRISGESNDTPVKTNGILQVIIRAS